jgi:hypothetical protein
MHTGVYLSSGHEHCRGYVNRPRVVLFLREVDPGRATSTIQGGVMDWLWLRLSRLQ